MERVEDVPTSAVDVPPTFVFVEERLSLENSEEDWSAAGGIARSNVRARTRFRTRAEKATWAFSLRPFVVAVKASGGEECAADERRARDVTTEVLFRCILIRLVSFFTRDVERNGGAWLPSNVAKMSRHKPIE
mmetsp:Transcript_16552/g.35964  ORF Transcript_16552/g.35964 Transcript_16552/m.35964 type:complete len:133 (+) Transcript_16552:1350-1748(+)